MKNSLIEGDKKVYEKIVTSEDTAAFHGEEVHPVYSTFALGHDAEWAGRLFVLELKEEDEEGIGTRLVIEHLSPAFVGERIIIEATLLSLKKREVRCSFLVRSGERIIAKGETSQKILKREKINEIFTSLQ